MTADEVKDWILMQDIPLSRHKLPMREQIERYLRDIGFDRVRVKQIDPHPVWNVSAQVGQSETHSVRSLKLALQRMCRDIGFRVKGNEIVASLYRSRVNAAFALLPQTSPAITAENQW